MPVSKRNVLGKQLQACCHKPKTGYFRNGYCQTDPRDYGRHVVCAKMTPEFLKFTKNYGNDLSTPRLEYGFPGLNPGERWCLCATRWKEAWEASVAPPVILEACDETTLQLIPLEVLKQYALKAVC